MEDNLQSDISGRNENKIEYATGVLETVYFLLEDESGEFLQQNIDHIKKLIPTAIEELKS
jgi:hypothetical protein